MRSSGAPRRVPNNCEARPKPIPTLLMNTAQTPYCRICRNLPRASVASQRRRWWVPHRAACG